MLEIAGELALGGWNLIKMGFGALGKFLGSLNSQGVVGLIVALILAFVAFHQWGEARHWHKEADRYQLLYNREQVVFAQTVSNYRAAAAKAVADDKANAERVKSQQNQISQEKSDAFEARLAAARALYQRLLAASPGHPGGGPVPPMSGISAPAGGPDEGAGQDGLSDRYICTAQSIQLDELEKWIAAQHAVDPNGR